MVPTTDSFVGDYIIADMRVRIIIRDTSINNMGLLPSFSVFKTTYSPDEEPMMEFIIDDTLPPVRLQYVDRIGSFPTGNGDVVVDLLPSGGYQYIEKDLGKHECSLLETNVDFSQCRCALKGTREQRMYGLNSAMMLAYAFSASKRQTLMMHASVVCCDGKAFPFIAKSGTGKSTHTSLWMKHIPGCELLNDDMPIIHIVDGRPYVYGSPWSGKTPCYRPRRMPLGAVTRIDRAPSNSIERLTPAEAFASLLPSCSQMKWDKRIYDAVCDNITKVVETTKIYTLHCLPDKEAALLCHKTLMEK